MRFLKKKIARAEACKEQRKNQKSIPNNILIPYGQNLEQQPTQQLCLSEAKYKKKRTRIPGCALTPQITRETKNIVQNYGRAICKFAGSPLALPYLMSFIEQEGKEGSSITLEGFVEFLNSQGIINGLYRFRSLLLIHENDNKEEAACKKVFKLISEVFIKYFSVNWIFQSRIQHKLIYLKYRFKMLRRVKCPELFTYLKNCLTSPLLLKSLFRLKDSIFNKFDNFFNCTYQCFELHFLDNRSYAIYAELSIFDCELIATKLFSCKIDVVIICTCNLFKDI